MEIRHRASLLQFLSYIAYFFYMRSLCLKGAVHPKIKNIFFLSVQIFINPDSFGLSCLVLEISSIEISAFSLNIMGLNGALNVVLTASKNTFKKNQQ